MKTGSLLAMLLVQVLLAAEEKTPSAITADIGGVTIQLPSDWKLVSQSSNAVVRARHSGLGIEMAAVRFTTDLSVTQCAAVMAAALIRTNTAAGLQTISKRVDLPRAEIEKTIASPEGKKLSKQTVGDGARFEFRNIFFQRVERGSEQQFDIQSQVVEKKLFRRDFLLRGSAAGEMVQVTYTGPSKAVFTDRGIIKSVRPQK